MKRQMFSLLADESGSAVCTELSATSWGEAPSAAVTVMVTTDEMTCARAWPGLGCGIGTGCRCSTSTRPLKG